MAAQTMEQRQESGSKYSPVEETVKGKADGREEDPEEAHGIWMGSHPGQGLGQIIQPDGLGGPQDHQGSQQQTHHGENALSDHKTFLHIIIHSVL